MSYWTYVNGTIQLDCMGRTQPEIEYIINTILDHLPCVSGSERDMSTYLIKKEGHNTSSSCDEFGEVTDNLKDCYGQRNRHRGWLQTQTKYILVVDGSLRDSEFEQTFREFQNWLCRLAKRVQIEDVLVEIKGYDKSTVIRNTNDVYTNMFEWPSWCRNNIHKHWKLEEKLKMYHPEKEYNEPTWCEYLMFSRAKNSDYPMLLGYKYYGDEENDAEVERRMDYEMS